jgi:hypothetical protein
MSVKSFTSSWFCMKMTSARLQGEAMKRLGDEADDFLLPRHRFDEGEAQAGQQGIHTRIPASRAMTQP